MSNQRWYVLITLLIQFFSQVLKRCKHPNVITLYAYNVSLNSAQQFVVYELAAKGSLSTNLDDEERRLALSGDHRIRIMYQVARALHFLHSGGCRDGHIRYKFFHRDIKSANICLMKDWTAKLIDCGFAKFLEIDEAQGTAQTSVTASMITSSGSVVFGTPGYICPWYSNGQGTRPFEASCDVFSFGIVMIELITGRLQIGQSSSRGSSCGGINFYELYVEDGACGCDILVEDADPLADWDIDLLNALCELAVQSISKDRKNRPSTLQLIARLGELNLAMETGQCPCSLNVDDENDHAPSCTCCNRNMKLHVTCRESHVICNQCMNAHMEGLFGCGDIPCPILGCESAPFTRFQLYGKVSSFLYEIHMRETNLNVELIRLNKKVDTSIQFQQDAAATMTATLCRITDVVERGHKALAFLSEKGDFKCPRIVWLVADNENKASGPVSWISSLVMMKVKLYFVCQYSFTLVAPPLHLEVPRKWVALIAPAFKVTLIVLCALSHGASAPFTIPFLGGEAPKKLNEASNFIDAFLDAGAKNALDDAGRSCLDGNFEIDRSSVKELVGPAYDLIARKANEPRKSYWKDLIRPTLNAEGTTIWVKKEFVN